MRVQRETRPPTGFLRSVESRALADPWLRLRAGILAAIEDSLGRIEDSLSSREAAKSNGLVSTLEPGRAIGLRTQLSKVAETGMGTILSGKLPAMATAP